MVHTKRILASAATLLIAYFMWAEGMHDRAIIVGFVGLLACWLSAPTRPE
jgi:hypothetical protein